MEHGHRIVELHPVRNQIRYEGRHTEDCEELLSEIAIVLRVILLEKL